MGQHLTAYHIKDDLAKTITDSFDPLLNTEKSLRAFSPSSDLGCEARLFIEETEPKPPPWLTFLEQGFDDLPELTTLSNNAVLFLRLPYGDDMEIFAFTFGMGRYLLQASVYDREYGLRVALNAIYEGASPSGPGPEPERVKRVSSKTPGANTLHTIRQYDGNARFEQFFVDTLNDHMTGITGMPVNQSEWNRRLSGSDSLSANPNVTLHTMKDYVMDILEYHHATWYMVDFDWMDDRRPVNDTLLIKNLQNYLVPLIKGTSSDIVSGSVKLTVPGVVEWDNVDHFHFSFDKDTEIQDLDELDLAQVLKNLEGSMENTTLLDDLSVKNLKDNWCLFMSYGDGTEVDWPLINCLYGEIKIDDVANGIKGTYILSEGYFYEISQDYIDQLDAYIRNARENKDPVPDSVGDITEGKYNEDAAAGCNDLLYMDKQLVRIGRNTSPIEVCDLLTPDGRFVHVKRKLSSSTLSHLFNQGYTSAELLFMNSEYRKKTLATIKEQEKEKDSNAASGTPSCSGKFCCFGTGNIDPRDYEVNYAIIYKWNGETLVEKMPFFAKVAYRKNAENLRRMGYNVSYARVNII